jgi:UDP-N-acetylmuramate dehydrogenase
MNTTLSFFIQEFPHLKFQEEFPLASLTTVKIGGPAELFCEITEKNDFISLIKSARQKNVPVTILGWGANTLIADRGIRGLVIRQKSQRIEIKEDQSTSSESKEVDARWQAGSEKNDDYPAFSQLDYDESKNQQVIVNVDGGVPLAYCINFLLGQSITGLQWFSRIPATVAGAVYNNIHGGTHFISEYVDSVEVVTDKGELKVLKADELEFGYDYSRFHHSNEIIITVNLKLFRGDTEKAKAVVREWAIQKKDQPQNSLGCVFQNLSQEQQREHNLPTPSVGYIVDQILHKKGFAIGDAQISQKHGAFIENKGQATAKEYLQVIREIVEETQKKLGITLKPEIFFKGFTAEELEFLK